jgi:hypothetical protein
MIPRIIGSPRHRMPVKSLDLRKFGRRAGAVVLALVALDLVATAATVAFGASWLQR